MQLHLDITVQEYRHWLCSEIPLASATNIVPENGALNPIALFVQDSLAQEGAVSVTAYLEHQLPLASLVWQDAAAYTNHLVLALPSWTAPLVLKYRQGERRRIAGGELINDLDDIVPNTCLPEHIN